MAGQCHHNLLLICHRLLAVGLSCRSKITRDLSCRFPTPVEAEKKLPPLAKQAPPPTVYLTGGNVLYNEHAACMYPCTQFDKFMHRGVMHKNEL